MARPVNADADQTRARILAVAIEQFGRDGFAATTMRRIAAGANITFATIHHHFGTKADLFSACVVAAFDQLVLIGARLVTELSTPPASDRLERAVRAAYRAAVADRSRSRFLLRAFVFEPPELSSVEPVAAQRAALLDSAVDALAGDRDRADLRIRLVGFSMLVTRFAAASELDRQALGDDVDPGGVVEDYLIDVARATLPTPPS